MENLRLFLLTIYCTLCFGYGAAIEICIGSSNQAVCPDGWVKSNDSCYFFQQEAYDFFGAQDVCEDYGGHLVHIESENENKFLQSQLKGRRDDHYRTGIYSIGTKGGVSYLFSEKDVLFTDFQPKANGRIVGINTCVVFSRAHNYQWDYNDCKTKSKSICEKKATPCPTCAVVSIEWILALDTV